MAGIANSTLYLISAMHSPNYIYRIMKTIDGGMNWNTLHEITGITIHDLTISEGGRLMAVGNFGNVFKSDDELNWLNTNANDVTILWRCIALSDTVFVIGGLN
jgi:photosystem II stability/assembly factor-like uncharacterized protein